MNQESVVWLKTLHDTNAIVHHGCTTIRIAWYMLIILIKQTITQFAERLQMIDLFHFYSLLTRKRQLRNRLDESAYEPLVFAFRIIELLSQICCCLLSIISSKDKCHEASYLSEQQCDKGAR